MRGILGIKPRLHRVAVKPQLILLERQGLAVGDTELPFHQIEPGDRLGDRMLDLQARVHLHEPEGVRFQAARAVGDELDRAGALVADRLGGGDRGLPHAGAQIGAHAGRRRLLDHLLVAALQRTVALAEMDDVAVAVGENLQLDVARVSDIFLDQHAGLAEGALRLALRGR